MARKLQRHRCNKVLHALWPGALQIASPPMVQSLACRETIEEIAEYLEDCASELDYELQQQQQAVQVRSLFYDMQSSVQ